MCGVRGNPDVKAFLKRTVADPLLQQLRQGITPSKLALSLALGLTLGAFPVLGVTTLLCAAVALALRLNQPAIQVANYAAYPLQLGLFLPFFQLGAWVFGAEPVSFSLEQVRGELAADLWGTVARYWTANLRAVGAWAIVAPAAGLLLFLVLRRVLSLLPLPAAEPDAAVPAK